MASTRPTVATLAVVHSQLDMRGKGTAFLPVRLPVSTTRRIILLMIRSVAAIPVFHLTICATAMSVQCGWQTVTHLECHDDSDQDVYERAARHPQLGVRSAINMCILVIRNRHVRT